MVSLEWNYMSLKFRVKKPITFAIQLIKTWVQIFNNVFNEAFIGFPGLRMEAKRIFHQKRRHMMESLWLTIDERNKWTGLLCGSCADEVMMETQHGGFVSGLWLRNLNST